MSRKGSFLSATGKRFQPRLGHELGWKPAEEANGRYWVVSGSAAFGSLRRHHRIGIGAFRFADQRAVIMVPWVEARRQDCCPFDEHPAHHARLPPQEGIELALRLFVGEAVLLQQADGIADAVAEVLLRDQRCNQCAGLVAFPRAPIAGRVQPYVVDQALVLDLFGCVPAPDIGSDRVGALKIARIGKQMPADDRREMLQRDGDREVEFLGATLGQFQHRTDALLDAFDIIAVI